MRRVPRHRFTLQADQKDAYGDFPLPIGHHQTISQPFIVAFMSQALALTAEDKLLEIGCGSGYQTAVAAEIVSQVYSLEIIPQLAQRASQLLEELGYHNVHIRVGDGHRGWPEEAPFDAIIVTAAPGQVPQALLQQLAIGGRLILPLGDAWQQELLLIRRTPQGYERQALLDVAFVPMTGNSEPYEPPSDQSEH